MGAVYTAIKQNADKYPEKLAIVQSAGGSLTYRELDTATRRVAFNLYQSDR